MKFWPYLGQRWKGHSFTRSTSLVKPGYIFPLLSYLLVFYYSPLWLFFTKEFEYSSTAGCLRPQCAIIVHAMAFLFWIHCPHPFSVLQQQLFAALSTDKDSFSLPSSVSIPLFHCLFTSFHRSMQHHSFSSDIELLCLLSASLSHTSSRLAITAYLLSLPSFPPLSLSYREHRILSVLSGTMATRKWFWHSCAWEYVRCG